MFFRNFSLPSATLPEFPVEDLDALLRNSGAPALVAIGNENLFGFNESLNAVGVGDIAAEMEAFYGESAPSPRATPLPDQQPPIETEEPIDDAVDTLMGVHQEQPLPPAPAEGLPEAGPVVPKKSKAAPRKGVTGGRIGKKIDHACERCRDHRQRCDGWRPCWRCRRANHVCTYVPGIRQLGPQPPPPPKPAPKASKKHGPVRDPYATPYLRTLLPRLDEPAPVSGGLAPGLGGMPQGSGIDRGLGESAAGAEEAQYDQHYDRNLGVPVAGAEGTLHEPNHDWNFGWPVASAEQVPDHQDDDWNFGAFDAGADGASQHLGGLDRESEALDVGSNGAHQYPQQAGPVFGGDTSQANAPWPFYEEGGFPFQGSAGPSNWRPPDIG